MYLKPRGTENAKKLPINQDAWMLQSIAVEAGKKRFWSNTGKLELQLLAIKTKMNP